jgi:hypothetical protein
MQRDFAAALHGEHNAQDSSAPPLFSDAAGKIEEAAASRRSLASWSADISLRCSEALRPSQS